MKAADMRRALDRIHAELDGVEWGSDTVAAIAKIIEDAGYTVREIYPELRQ